jgi:hypothetical protein
MVRRRVRSINQAGALLLRRYEYQPAWRHCLRRTYRRRPAHAENPRAMPLGEGHDASDAAQIAGRSNEPAGAL